jgi:hypothetical protein
MFEARAAILYNVYDADNGPHPHEDRLVGIAAMIREMHALGVTTDILYGEQAPQTGNVPPQVGVASSFTYDKYDKLVDAKWKKQPGDLSEYDLVIDKNYRWMHHTPDINRPDHYVSPGIGLPVSHAINPSVVHQFGNDKTLAYQKLLVPNKAGIDTYTIEEIERLSDAWGDVALFAKPVSGSNGRDIKEPLRLAALQKMIIDGEITSDYQIQPRIDQTLPIDNLVAYKRKDQADLQRILNDRSRVKERRNHVFARMLPTGDLDIQIFPTLRAGKPGASRMGSSQWVALSAESLPERSSWHDTLTAVTRTLHDQASRAHPQVPLNFMVVIDDAEAGLPNGDKQPMVVEMNCRFPHLPAQARDAQKTFPRFAAKVAIGNAAYNWQ